MATIQKKTWPEQFQAILDGHKTFDARIADFNCQIGDELALKEWDPKKSAYTGREVRKKVTYVLKSKEVAFWPEDDFKKHGLQILGFK